MKGANDAPLVGVRRGQKFANGAKFLSEMCLKAQAGFMYSAATHAGRRSTLPSSR